MRLISRSTPGSSGFPRSSGPSRPITRKRLLAAAAVFVGLVLATWFLGRFVIVRMVLHRALAGAGLEPATFQIRSVGLDAMEVADLSLGSSPWLTVGHVLVNYSLRDLFAGRVQLIEVHDARWTVNVRDGVIDWGFPSRPSTGAGTPGAGTPGAAKLDFPFDRLDLRSSALRIIVDDAAHEMPFTGQLVRTAAHGTDDHWTFTFQNQALSPDAPIAAFPTRGGARFELHPAGMQITGRLDQNGLSLKLAPGPIGSLVTYSSEEFALRSPPGSRPLTVTIGEPGGVAFIPLGSKKSWTVEVPIVDVTVADVSISGAAVRADKVGFTLPVSVRADDSGLHLDAIRPAIVSVQSARFASGTWAADVLELNLALAPLPGMHLASLSFTESPAAAFNAGIRNTAPVSLTWESLAMKAAIESLAGDFQATIDARGLRIGQGTLAMNGGSLIQGDVGLSNVGARLAMSESGEIAVYELVATTNDGGALSADSFAFAPEDQRIEARFVVENLSLAKLLPLLTNDRASGDGRISGGLDLAIDWRQDAPTFEFLAASLRATPKHGFIQVSDADAVGDLLESQNPQFAADGSQRDVRDRIVAALHDFAFSDLTLDIVRVGDQALATVHTSGQGRQGDDPQALNLTVEIPNFDRIVALAIALNSKLDAGTNRALEHFFSDDALGQEARP